MIKAGIIDPAKVTRSALQNAASVAALLDQHAIPAFSRCEFPACWPTTECAITDITESKAAPAGGPGMGGMGGMGGMDY